MSESIRLITIKEGASMLGLAPKTLYAYKGGTAGLSRVRLGSSVRLVKEEIEALIEQQLKKAA